MKRYFITGTDTDCGKTYVTCQLLNYFKKSNQRAIGLKPVASGCGEQNGQLISNDALHIQSCNDITDLDICAWRYKPPISPHIAAAQVGEVLSLKAVLDFCNEKAFANHDYQLIEGAGGLMAPLNDNETWLDFLSYSKIPVILVVGMRLGCLNHALLTDFALKAHNIECAGWIANCLDAHMLYLKENIKTLSEKLHMPLLATIPYGETLQGMLGLR